MFVDLMYAKILGSRLVHFKQKKSDLFEYACPMCGDSKGPKMRARAYLYRTPSGLNAQCKHCGYSRTLGNFIKDFDPLLYKEYILEKFKGQTFPIEPMSEDVKKAQTYVEIFNQDSVLDSLKRIDLMKEDHPARLLIVNRKIPEKYWKLFYYTPKFKHYVNSVLPGKFDDKSLENGNTPRIIIPYFDTFGKVFTFQGRSFGQEEPRYFTIKLTTRETIFGLERVDYSKRIYVTEGPIDSLFLKNGIAVSGSSFDLPSIQAIKTNSTICFDNERRSKEITNLILKVIKNGYSVYLPPDSLQEKDINDAILSGISESEMMNIINENTFQGPAALLRFNYWRKC